MGFEVIDGGKLVAETRLLTGSQAKTTYPRRPQGRPPLDARLRARLETDRVIGHFQQPSPPVGTDR